jgi:hypothetical protein
MHVTAAREMRTSGKRGLQQHTHLPPARPPDRANELTAFHLTVSGDSVCRCCEPVGRQSGKHVEHCED